MNPPFLQCLMRDTARAPAHFTCKWWKSKGNCLLTSITSQNIATKNSHKQNKPSNRVIEMPSKRCFPARTVLPAARCHRYARNLKSAHCLYNTKNFQHIYTYCVRVETYGSIHYIMLIPTYTRYQHWRA